MHEEFIPSGRFSQCLLSGNRSVTPFRQSARIHVPPQPANTNTTLYTDTLLYFIERSHPHEWHPIKCARFNVHNITNGNNRHNIRFNALTQCERRGKCREIRVVGSRCSVQSKQNMCKSLYGVSYCTPLILCALVLFSTFFLGFFSGRHKIGNKSIRSSGPFNIWTLE